MITRWQRQLHKATRMTIRGLFVASFCFFFMNAHVTHAETFTSLAQEINDYYSAVFTDANGAIIIVPMLDFEKRTVDNKPQQSQGALGDHRLRIRITTASNAIDTWTMSLAASEGSEALWRSENAAFDYNDTNGPFDGTDRDYAGGQMHIDPVHASIRGLSGTSLSKISLGAEESFVEDSIDSIDLLNAAYGSDNPGEWEMTEINIKQNIPAGQAVGVYAIDMLLTIS